MVNAITGTTVSNIRTNGLVWNNTADNITNMTFAGSVGQLGIGTRVIILKSNNFTNGTPTGVITTPYIKGAWVRVGSQVLGSAASSVTFSGLDGDRDVVYYLSIQWKASGACACLVRPNNSSTASTYGQQTLLAQNTTFSAARAIASNSIVVGWDGTTSGLQTRAGILLFAKSGFIRPSIRDTVENINGTTVTTLLNQGGSWNNTSDNITSIVCSTDANNFDTGSQFDLYALRPNG
jgi:hypothetical protein